jgi:hypothetical protein
VLTKSLIRTANLIPLSTSTPVLGKMTTASAPGENFEVRQTSATEDWHPDRKVYLMIDHYFCLWELS